MQILLFKDIIKFGLSNFEDKIIKQLALARYNINNQECLVIIEGPRNKFIKVVIDNTFTRSVIRDRLNANLLKEPVIKLFYTNLYHGIDPSTTGKQPLINFLTQYQIKYMKKGYELKNKLSYKFYSPDPKLLNTDLRKIYGVKYIDYNKQLDECTSKKIIHNEEGLNGIWTSTPSKLEASLKEHFVNHLSTNYGNILLILEVIDDCYYFESDDEIIGNQFKVLEKIILPFEKKEWFKIIEDSLNKFKE